MLQFTVGGGGVKQLYLHKSTRTDLDRVMYVTGIVTKN